MMGCEHVLNLCNIGDAEVVAVSDPHGPSRELAVACVDATVGAERAAALATYEHHRELLARDDLDAVIIASPNHTHADVLADVLAHDLHVMVEKPLCTTVPDALRMRFARRRP